MSRVSILTIHLHLHALLMLTFFSFAIGSDRQQYLSHFYSLDQYASDICVLEKFLDTARVVVAANVPQKKLPGSVFGLLRLGISPSVDEDFNNMKFATDSFNIHLGDQTRVGQFIQNIPDIFHLCRFFLQKQVLFSEDRFVAYSAGSITPKLIESGAENAWAIRNSFPRNQLIQKILQFESIVCGKSEVIKAILAICIDRTGKEFTTMTLMIKDEFRTNDFVSNTLISLVS